MTKDEELNHQISLPKNLNFDSALQDSNEKNFFSQKDSLYQNYSKPLGTKKQRKSRKLSDIQKCKKIEDEITLSEIKELSLLEENEKNISINFLLQKIITWLVH